MPVICLMIAARSARMAAARDWAAFRVSGGGGVGVAGGEGWVGGVFEG